jgi:DNA-binding XRE family transcriptional regulator
MEERARNGQGQYAWKATEDIQRAHLSGSALADASGKPLYHRLRSAREECGYTLSQFADLFGVSKQAVSDWEIGPDPDENGHVHGKQIPLSLVPLIKQWIVTGQAPTPKQLTNRKNSRGRYAKTTVIMLEPSTSRSTKYSLCQPPTQQNEALSTSRSANRAQLKFEENRKSNDGSMAYEGNGERSNASLMIHK